MINLDEIKYNINQNPNFLTKNKVILTYTINLLIACLIIFLGVVPFIFGANQAATITLLTLSITMSSFFIPVKINELVFCIKYLNYRKWEKQRRQGDEIIIGND